MYGLNAAMHTADCIKIKTVLYIGEDVPNVCVLFRSELMKITKMQQTEDSLAEDKGGNQIYVRKFEKRK